MKYLFLFLTISLFMNACETADRPTMGTVRLKSDATTDSIEHVVNEMLVAISTNDLEKAKYNVLEEGRVFSVQDDGLTFRSNSEFFKKVGDQSTDYYERMWNPIIMYRGDLAIAWTTYDFHLNDKFSHCGAESFTLTRVDNRWMVMDWAYTANEPKNCNSPLGPIEK
ncbi:MAG: hypothetical protein QGF89_05815 [Candidatus Marinimicrobia bacterium]|nr:hypothetical protein [Candidatus Neomarinimicrobiota bacterium]